MHIYRPTAEESEKWAGPAVSVCCMGTLKIWRHRSISVDGKKPKAPSEDTEAD